MTVSPAELRAQRTRHKQDLLLASALVRQQAAIAVGQIDQRVNVIVLGYRQVRGWLTVPQMGMAAGVVGSLATLLAMRHLRAFRLLRWALVGWRVSKIVTALMGQRHTAR